MMLHYEKIKFTIIVRLLDMCHQSSEVNNTNTGKQTTTKDEIGRAKPEGYL